MLGVEAHWGLSGIGFVPLQPLYMGLSTDLLCCSKLGCGEAEWG